MPRVPRATPRVPVTATPSATLPHRRHLLLGGATHRDRRLRRHPGKSDSSSIIFIASAPFQLANYCKKLNFVPLNGIEIIRCTSLYFARIFEIYFFPRDTLQFSPNVKPGHFLYNLHYITSSMFNSTHPRESWHRVFTERYNRQNIPFYIVRKGEHEPSLVIFLAREKSCERMGAQWDRKV